MAERVLLVELGIDATNDDIIDQMRIMKRAREEGVYDNVICVIRAFDDDPRELYDIPEVRAFCRRIVNLAFISYLDVATTLVPDAPELVRKGWGAAEAWLCAEGRYNTGTELTMELLGEIEKAVGESNEKADALLGPME
jgi:hypothetical protein